MLAISQILNVVADVLRRCCRCHVSTLTKSCCPPALSFEGRARPISRPGRFAHQG
jgi:ADP-glucose pyrophosphorylase